MDHISQKTISISLRTIASLLRVHQWSKNLLIFVPAILAHRIGEPKILFQSVRSFLAFSLAASAGYVFNDLVDLERDQKHPVKRLRSLADRKITVSQAALLIALLTFAAFGIGSQLSVEYLLALVGYLILSTGYTLFIKRVAVADVLLLGCLYTWRVFAGGVATGVVLSAWLLAFSVFLFFSLAIAKRVSELLTAGPALGRDYGPEDLPLLFNFGIASGYTATLIFALYLSSENVKRFYPQPQFLWLILPILIYWTTRFWLFTHRGKINADPILFALKDPVSYGVTGLTLGLVWIAHQTLFVFF